MTSPSSSSKKSKKPVRIWVDGCFDMMHFGHANALRQAKAFGDVLVVGVHSDAEILKNKGPTVMNEEERYEAVRACKWVDEVVPDAPYLTTVETLDKYNCDFCVHGDDITTMADGSDCYGLVKAAGRYQECKRTIGVSTTELVGRMLLMTRDNKAVEKASSAEAISHFHEASPYTKVSPYLPSTRRITQFQEGLKDPKSSDTVVYADGGFDLFHIGHIEFLKKAKELGDYLIVGVHDDQTISRIKGVGYPIMNIHERTLSVLSCRYVDEVIIGAPFSVTKEIIKGQFKVDIVAHGKTKCPKDSDGSDPYKLAKELDIYKEIETPMSSLSCETIISRIIKQRQLYEERNRKKEAKELALLKSANASPTKEVGLVEVEKGKSPSPTGKRARSPEPVVSVKK